MTEEVQTTVTPESGPSEELRDQDKLLAALSYPISIVISLIILLVEDLRARPFLKYHAVQSLAVNIVLWVVIAITAPFTCGITSILWLITLYWAWEAYNGKYFTIPVVTDFIKNQGWV